MRDAGAVNPFEEAVVDVDRWRFAAPPEPMLESARYVDDSPWGELLAEHVARDPQRLETTRAMHCAAREFARFYVEHAAFPAVALRRALFEHCGSVVEAVAPYYLFGALEPEHDEAALLEAWRPQVLALLGGMRDPGLRELGIAFARDERKAVVVLVSGARQAQIEPVSRVVGSDGTLVLRGRALVPADHIAAQINRGRFGYAPCDVDRGVRAPEFSVTCRLDPADRSARIDVSAHREGRILGETLLAVEARRDARQLEYERVAYADEALVANQAELRSELLELVNAVRGEAGLGPLTLSAAESATSDRLAPIYFRAMTDSSKEVEAEMVVLGLLAGWDVGAPIRGAGFTSAAVGPTRDASEWLAAVLAGPSGRSALLGPDARVLALGTVVSDSPPVVAAVATSYALFEGDDYAEIKRRVVEKITAARAAAGLPAPIVVATLDGDAGALAAQVNAGALTPNQALGELLQVSARVLGGPVRGLAFEAVDIEQMQLPDVLSGPQRLELSITVTHYQPAAEPWGRYLVLLVIPGEGVRA